MSKRTAVKQGVEQGAEFVGSALREIVAKFGGEPLPGAPAYPNIPGRGVVRIGRNEEALRAAEDYAARNDMTLDQVYEYVGVDPDRARRIASEYERMKHAPDDPEVKQAYEALARETLDQYESMLSAGVEPYFIRGKDPYANSPYEALIELDQTNRLGVFPTDAGFGTDAAFDATGNPLLADSGFKIGGEKAVVNDIFRAVHDYMGHAKQGAGFRGMGEENAYQAHAPMFSNAARRALASETRGQNSWLNYGPYGDANRRAKIDDTVFADQKTGLMPIWTAEEGRVSAGARRGRFQSALRELRTGLEGAVDSDGRVSLVHYARTPLDRIEPERQLTGLAGRSPERSRLSATGPDAAPKRSYYGIEADINPYRKEQGLGAHKHKALLDGELLYDVAKDPDKLWMKGDPSGSESAIKSQNYSGYYFDHPQLGKVAVVYDPLDAVKLNEGGFANPILLAGLAGGAGLAAMASNDAEAGVGMAGSGAVSDVIKSALRGIRAPSKSTPFSQTDQSFAEQVPLDRVDPPRGAPASALAVMTPENTKRLMSVAQKGIDKGGDLWYNTRPIYEAFATELGDEPGREAFGRFMDYIAATSPRSTVGQNIRRGSMFYQMDRQGLDPAGLTNPDLPAGYGHLAHGVHSTMMSDLSKGGSFSGLTRPKASSFAENLKGNLRPLTVDTHNTQSVTGTKRSPKATEYPYFEQYEAAIAERMGLDPAQFQSSVWVGDDTGVADVRNFNDLFDEAVVRTALRNKDTKEGTLKKFIRGEIPLYSLVAGTALSQFLPAEEAQAMQQMQMDQAPEPMDPAVEAEIDSRISKRLQVRQFQQRNERRQSRYAGLREQLLSTVSATDRMIGSAFEAIEMPTRGILALTSAAGQMAAGGGMQQALSRGAQVAQQPIDQTADQVGGQVTDDIANAGYPGIAPVVGTAVNAGIQFMGP